MIASTSQKTDFTAVLRNLRSRYDQLFGNEKASHLKNALIVSLLDQTHYDLALKKNFDVVPVSTELEKRESTDLGTKGLYLFCNWQ